MPPPRPYWKGYLKLSLVSCPIALYTPTSSSEKVAFRQINKKTGNRLRQVDEDTGDVVESADKGKGYEVEKGIYLRVEDEEIEAIAIESNHTIDIDRFVPKAQIDERYVDSPYCLVPNDKAGLDAFAVIRDAMRDKGMVASVEPSVKTAMDTDPKAYFLAVWSGGGWKIGERVKEQKW